MGTGRKGKSNNKKKCDRYRGEGTREKNKMKKAKKRLKGLPESGKFVINSTFQIVRNGK